jgi:hypothetical protein
VDVKSPKRENCTPGSVRGAPGNWRPYLDVPGKRRSKWNLSGLKMSKLQTPTFESAIFAGWKTGVTNPGRFMVPMRVKKRNGGSP